MKIALALLAVLHCPALAAPQRGLTELHRTFLEELDPAKRVQALDEMSRSVPKTKRDIQALFDLFSRFPTAQVRAAVMGAIFRLDPRSVGALENAFLEYLKEPEPESVLFGINGALRLRSSLALPVIRGIAEKPFKHKNPQDAQVLSERNEWWTQYEALSALAQWEGPKAYSLLKSRAEQAPQVARLMGTFLWEKTLPQSLSWAGRGATDRERAMQALKAPADVQSLRLTRPILLQKVLDAKTDRDVRHELALKLGHCSTPEEISGLLAEYEGAKDPDTKLMLSASLFTSRSPQVIPLLRRHAQEAPEARTRLGALVQLIDMLGPEPARADLEWSAKNDPDAENRKEASALLEEKR